MTFASNFGLSTMVLFMALTRCARPNTEANTPARSEAMVPSGGACVEPKEEMRCDAFDDGGFADAHTYFFHASAEQIRAAYAHQGSAVRAGMLGGFASLFCFGVTEQELEPLGQALGLPKPAARKAQLTPEQLAKVMEGLSGRRPEASELPDSVPGSYLNTERVVPDSCTTLYRVPGEFLARLRAESNAPDLAARWVRAIESFGPRADVPASDAAVLERLRRDMGRWTKVATALTRFVSANSCDERDLYVEVTYDC
jgi:hypothetical protein